MMDILSRSPGAENDGHQWSQSPRSPRVGTTDVRKNLESWQNNQTVDFNPWVRH